MSIDSDRELSRLYREGAREEPSPALDARIAAAAREELMNPPRQRERGPSRWYVPLAAAAVLTVAVSLHWLAETPEQPPVPSLQADRSEAATSQAEAPAGAASKAPGDPASASVPFHDAAPSAAPSQAAQPAVAERDGASRIESARTRSVEGSTPVPPPAAAQPSKRELAVASEPILERRSDTSEPERQSPGNALAPPANPPAQSAPASPVAAAPPSAESAGPRPSTAVAQGKAGISSRSQLGDMRSAAREATADPERWLREIEELQRAGHILQAKEQLEAFRKRFPDYSLPPSLQP